MELAVAKTRTYTHSRTTGDYELVQSAIDGNQQAYSVLMERYQHSIYHTMFKMVNNRDDANDLTIEAFSKAFHKLQMYTPTYAFSTWLFKIAVNNCIDHIRKKRIHFLSIDEPIEPNGEHDFANNIRDHLRNPEEEMVRQQRILFTQRLLKQLTQKYRTMIELRYYQELSYDEIAQELGIPLGTVKAQLFRAKELLFAMLQQPGAQAYFETTRRRKGGG